MGGFYKWFQYCVQFVVFDQKTVVAELRSEYFEACAGDVVAHVFLLPDRENYIGSDADQKRWTPDRGQCLFDPSAASAHVVGVERFGYRVVGICVISPRELLALIALVARCTKSVSFVGRVVFLLSGIVAARAAVAQQAQRTRGFHPREARR